MQAKTDGKSNTDRRVPAHVRQGLLLLLQAWLYAEDAGRDVWDFSLERAALHRAGLTDSDLRWLLCKGLIEHAREITKPGAHAREFHCHRSLTFFKRSAFVLTAAGASLAKELAGHEGLSGVVLPKSAISLQNGDGLAKVEDARESGEELVPKWDRDRHELRVGSVLVKDFKVPSPNQETILAAFEEEKWPPRVDDPLPPHPELNSKRRLHDTIKSLNRNQKNRKIRFMGDGTGEGVRWEYVSKGQSHRRRGR